VPQTNQVWEAIARRYEQLLSFNNCIGTLDGKHIKFKPPHNSGSDYNNYKLFFSLLFVAIVDKDYRFIYNDIGCNG
uniref:DDE Tnp4 domain-containing protein n=1 Tax=Amphimedon queenslandica TaxID=400682 RepID=A0A1X7U0M5_AMPQE